eukprot:gnl/TRDRNA2_/TRDRNA2_171372_c4_seq2.p2 gnl/TRDRNA2_/TRDRNA2_171372_c4~~gnl/TRDRNA2_/TRDRNA2_171372_c4_seq2.p2  ORF type:complete len:107 (+),score=6.94 gnl/TRDRNA2_/TRDRNA2_171372_c4_seq2:298-618(+)
MLAMQSPTLQKLSESLSKGNEASRAHDFWPVGLGGMLLCEDLVNWVGWNGWTGWTGKNLPSTAIGTDGLRTLCSSCCAGSQVHAAAPPHRETSFAASRASLCSRRS